LFLFSALMVALCQHPLFSFLFLGSSILLAAFLIIILKLELIAFLPVMICVGGTSVLFLYMAMDEISFEQFRTYYALLWVLSVSLLYFPCYN
jgi:NADH:ubiquinone oxidoreductase subunit 6 (subunit J)